MSRTDIIIYRFGQDFRIRETPFGWLMISLKDDGSKFMSYDSTVEINEALADFKYRLKHNMLDDSLVGN